MTSEFCYDNNYENSPKQRPQESCSVLLSLNNSAHSPSAVQLPKYIFHSSPVAFEPGVALLTHWHWHISNSRVLILFVRNWKLVEEEEVIAAAKRNEQSERRKTGRGRPSHPNQQPGNNVRQQWNVPSRVYFSSGLPLPLPTISLLTTTLAPVSFPAGGYGRGMSDYAGAGGENQLWMRWLTYFPEFTFCWKISYSGGRIIRQREIGAAPPFHRIYWFRTKRVFYSVLLFL